MLSEDTPVAVKEIQATEDAQEVAEHWEKEVGALRTMNELNQEHIVRFITAFRRRRERGGEEHYLMFEWADVGNLCDLWKKMPSPVLTARFVKEIIKQILGLAKALEAAHNLNPTGASYRHGDLKPENILVFSNGGPVGTFKIGDWGEARGHDQATEMRPSKTAAKYGTRRYEAPEVVIGIRSTTLGDTTKRRSRLYDIWAMGCITLELLIWLLYGVHAVTRFHNELGNDTFYQITNNNGRKNAIVHHVVTHWMDQMSEDPRCRVGATAIGNLLEIVRTALLIVKLPQRLGKTMEQLPQRNRKDSGFIISGMEDTDVDSEGLVVEGEATIHIEKPASDIPSFSFTPAEPELPQAPLQPEPEFRGNARCLSNDLRRRLEEINSEDEDEGYWCLDGSHHSMPESLSQSNSAPISTGISYQTPDYGTADYETTDGGSKTYTEASNTDSHGLAAPNRERVGVITTCTSIFNTTNMLH